MASPSSEILANLKTFGIIAVVTILVWLLAESESLRTDKVQVHVGFHSPVDSGRLVRVDPGQDYNGTVSLRLEGPTSRVDALAAALNKKDISLEPGAEGVPAEPGRHTVSLLTALRAYPSIRDSGVSVVDADPATAAISVDNLVIRDAKVRVDLPDGQLLESAPESSPAVVHVRLPEAAVRSLPPDFTVPVTLDPDALKNLPEGRRSSITLPVELPEPLRSIDGAKSLTPTVSVSLTLRARTDSVTLPAVPVHLRIAPTEIGLWDIQIPETSRQLTDVTITGPSDRIADIKSGISKPIAFVPVSFEELEKAAASGQPLEKEPIFTDLPTALRFEVKQKTVRLTVKRRENPAAAPASPSVSAKPPPP